MRGQRVDTIHDSPMPAEQERALYYAGIACFNAGEFFQAHERWEEVWHLVDGPKRRFYQGLIQCAVALEHYRRGNWRGVRSLARSYPGKFAGLPAVFLGLEIEPFLNQMRQVLRPVLEMPIPPEPGALELDLARSPAMVLLHDPFAMGSG